MTTGGPSIPQLKVGFGNKLHAGRRGENISGNERILRPISLAELERRWTTVRPRSSERGIDALAEHHRLARWISQISHGLPANNGYRRTVIFPTNDLIAVVEMGRFDGIQTAG